MITVPEPTLLDLCAQFEIDRQSLAFLGGGREDSDGIAYVYPHPHGPRVLKVMVVSGQDQGSLLPIRERVKFVRFLGEHGVDIVFPIQTGSGELFVTCREGRYLFVAYTMEKIDGIHVRGDLLVPDFAQRYGKLIGKLHQVSKQYPTWQRSVVDGQAVLGWEQEWQGFYDWSSDSFIKERWLSIRSRLEKLPITRDTFGFIHNDPHANNLLVCPNRLVLLDFDVANYHWFINDVAITLQPILFSRAGGMERPVGDVDMLVKYLANFVRGYRTENDLPDFWLEQIDLFINYRRLLLFTVMQGWLSKKPKIRAAWKKMITSEPPVFQ